MFYRNGNK